jgi:hypothetical protein
VKFEVAKEAACAVYINIATSVDARTYIKVGLSGMILRREPAIPARFIHVLTMG